MRWIQLSDLHFNFTDYETNENYDTSYLKKELIDTLSNISNIDFVVITGDCLYRFNGSDNNIDSFIDFSKEIINACGIKKNNLYLTPGNHDVNRDDVKRNKAIKNILKKEDHEISDAELKSLSSSGYDRFKNLHKEITGRKYEIDYVIERDHYNIINIDTCITSCCDKEEGNLLCYLPKLKSSKYKSSKINIVLMHHGFDCFRNAWSRRFQNWSEDNNIDVVLCGHSHIAGVRTLDSISTNIKQFTCGAAKVDEYAVPSFYVFDYDDNTSQITASLYTFFSNISKWKLDTNHIRAFSDGIYQYYISRKGNYIFNDFNNVNTVEQFVLKEQQIINLLNEKFLSVYGDEFYSSKTGEKEGFNAETAIYSIVQMDVPYVYALQIVNSAVNTICSESFVLELDKQEIWSSDFRKVVYKTICELSPNQEHSKEDINTIASKYARRYGPDKRMQIHCKEKTVDLDRSYIQNLYCEIQKNVTGISSNSLPRREKDSIENFVMSFLQHLDVHEIDNTSVVNFISVIITSPPHPWLLAFDKEYEIRNYHKKKIEFHRHHLKNSFNELTVVENIYHSSVLLLSYYSRLFGCTERYPIGVIYKALNEIIQMNFSEKSYISLINIVEMTKDINAINVDKNSLFSCVEFLQDVIKKPISSVNEKDRIINDIELFESVVLKISDYIDNKKHKVISSNDIINASDNKIRLISAFFSSIEGVFVKKPLEHHNYAFWFSHHFDKSEIEFNQVLVAVYSDSINDDIFEYIKQSNCEERKSAIILLKPDLDVFSDEEVNVIINSVNEERRFYFMSRSSINKINNSDNKRSALKEYFIKDKNIRN